VITIPETASKATRPMGVLGNIYCIPEMPGSVAWSTILTSLVQRAVVRPPYRSGSPFEVDSDRTAVLWPENWLIPQTLRPTRSSLPLRDYQILEDALAYVRTAPDATLTMDSPCSAFQVRPDERDLSAALALYRFDAPVPFRVGVPQDFSDLVDEFPDLANQPTEPRWQGLVTEMLWLHGKCVPSENDFSGSPLHEVLKSIWPRHLLLEDVFL
jgi:hypothetical protein